MKTKSAWLLLSIFLFSSCGDLNFSNLIDGNLKDTFVTYLGASTKSTGLDYEGCYGVVLDKQGNIYCGGVTKSDLSESNAGGMDIILAKFSSTGKLLWLRQQGAVSGSGDHSGDDFCGDLTIDSNNNLYCAGYSTGSFGETQAGGGDALIVKFNSQGEIIWTFQLGQESEINDSSAYDICNSVVVDSSGNVYCSGMTLGSLAESNPGGRDAFILKLNSNGELQWLTHFGNSSSPGDNSGVEGCIGIALDSLGNVYCGGYTDGSFGESYAGGGADIFILKVNNSGVFQWITQLGTETGTGDNSGREECERIAIDSQDNIYCVGYTQGATGESNAGNSDALVIKVGSDGSLKWIKQLGSETLGAGFGEQNDTGYSIAIDSTDSIYIGGYSKGSMFEGNPNAPTADDLIAFKLDSDGKLKWGTQFGSKTGPGEHSGQDYCFSVAVDKNNGFYCGGTSNSNFKESSAGNYDLILVKLNASTGKL